MRRLLAWLGLVPPVSLGVCRCGHPVAAHEHYRPGSDCAVCEAGECDQLRDEVTR